MKIKYKNQDGVTLTDSLESLLYNSTLYWETDFQDIQERLLNNARFLDKMLSTLFKKGLINKEEILEMVSHMAEYKNEKTVKIIVEP